jgi:hypothetical protein
MNEEQKESSMAKLMIKPILERLDNINERINELFENLVKQKPIPSANTPKTPETTPNIIDGNKLKVNDIQVLDKSYKIKNENGLIAFIGKSLIENVDLNNNILTVKDTSKWLLGNDKLGNPKIQWKEDTQT